MAAQNPAVDRNNDVNHWVGRLKGAVANPNELTQPTGPDHSAWHEGFFDCCTPVDTCLLTCCCPCITFGKTHHRLNKDAALKGYSPVNVSCLGWWVSACFGVPCIPQMLQRHDIRSRYHLQGEGVMDCLKAWCCACCDLVQQDKEATYHLLNNTPMVTSQPEKAGGMSYGAPQEGAYSQQPMPAQQGGYTQQPIPAQQGVYEQQPIPAQHQ